MIACNNISDVITSIVTSIIFDFTNYYIISDNHYLRFKFNVND